MNNKEEKLKVENYGDMLAQVKGKELVSFTMFGDYQGEWFGVLKNEGELEFWRGYYGSCSGCDFLEAEGEFSWEDDFNGHFITRKSAEEYFKEETPFLVAEENVIMKASIEELRTLLPKKVLDDAWDFDMQEFYNDLHKKTTTKERNA